MCCLSLKWSDFWLEFESSPNHVARVHTSAVCLPGESVWVCIGLLGPEHGFHHIPILFGRLHGCWQWCWLTLTAACCPWSGTSFRMCWWLWISATTTQLPFSALCCTRWWRHWVSFSPWCQLIYHICWGIANVTLPYPHSTILYHTIPFFYHIISL